MSKEKIKGFIVRNQKRILAVSLVLIAILLIVGINVYANRNDDYVVEIKDDGAQNITQDDNSSVTKKIVEDEAKSLTYEVQVKNLAPSDKIPEVAIVFDSSKSMSVNDNENGVKAKAVQFATELRTYSPRTKISLSSNTGVKVGMSTSALATYTNGINAIGYSDGESVGKAIDYATSTFSSADTDKFLIIFSDATDTIKDRLETLVNNGVEIYAILPEITNSEYQNDELQCTSQMISDITDFSSIYYKTNKSMVNVELRDIFKEEAIEYFDFEIVSKENDVEIEETDNGYILRCGEIRAGETRTLKYKLTLKEDVRIDAGKIYRTFESSNSIDIKYKDYLKVDQSYEIENSPTFVICKKYSLTIKAVSEKSNDLPIESLDVKVLGTTIIGQDEEGKDIVKTIFDETLTTDSRGKIIIDELKTLGDIKFEIKPLVNQFGYVETSATQIIVHNDPTGVGTIWAESDVSQPNVDVVNRNITVMLPISVQTYDMEVETVDLIDSRVKLGNIEYRLIQPKLNSKYEMEALYGKSDDNGNLVFKPAVMTKDGTYEYILTQMSAQDGYDPMGNATLIVTFKDGKVTKIDHKHSERVTTELISDSQTKVTVGNAALKDDTFFLEINLADELTGEKLFGAMYDILVSRTTIAGDKVTSPLNGYMTDENGKINLEIPGTGYINIKITEKSPKAGYVPDTIVKEITFLRKEGRVQYISSKEPTNINAIADTDNNKIIVNLTSKQANEQNRIQVHLIDNNERDVNIPNVLLSINKVGDTALIYATTDRNGIANFIIPNEERGSYQYEIGLFSAAPSGYLVPTTQLGTITVQCDENGHVVSASDVSHTVPYINVSFNQMSEEGYMYDTAIIDLALEADPKYSYNVRISLLDGNNMNKGLAGAKYSILIESDGEEIKYLAGKLTDANGNYTTRIIGDGKEIRITITQTATLEGYIKTTTSQVIELETTDAGYVLTNSGPNTYEPANGNYIGAELKGKELIYHDKNDCKTGANTILNLHVNKMDTNDFLASGIKVKLSSDTLLQSDGTPLDSPHKVIDSQGNEVTDESGNPIIRNYYETDQNGFFETLGIRVKGDELNNGERIDYLYMNELDNNGNIIDNTDITFKITFRLNKNTQVIEVTNVEATWGNRLLKDKTYSSRETDIAYESDVYLDIYTNFDDVGNFSLDLKKVNKEGEVLPGAKYDIVVIRPDSTRLVRKDINVTDNVELEGILVSKGTKIEVTEKVAPIGYEINRYTEVITITEVNTITGLVTCTLEPGSYATPRAKISNTQPVVNSDGVYKLCVTLDVIDYEMDTFKLGIKTKDSKYGTPVQGYTFNIATSEGAQKISSPTNNEGKTTVQVGANYKIENYEVTYTITGLKVANYYKKLLTPIELKIIFDLNGNVVSDLTHTANQAKPGYGTIWNIEATNVVGGNDIDIVINIEPCDPLIVNVQTVDTMGGQTLTNVEYKIEPTINLPGTGTTRLESGFVFPDGIQTYTIKQTNAGSINNYEPIPEQQIKIVYDAEGNVISLEELTGEVHKISINGKEITISIDIEPRVPITIKNETYFGAVPITNAKYEITMSNDEQRNMTTDINGEDLIYLGKFEAETSRKYTVKQTEVPYGYTKVENFEIEVFFDNEKNIVDTKILGDVNKYVEFAKVTHTTPSENTDKGYNGNDKGIVNIIVRTYPAVQFNIENVDRRDNNIKLVGTTYKVESSIGTKDESVITNNRGIGVADLDKSGYEKTVTYTITETTPSSRYQKFVLGTVIEVDFDSKGYITGTPRVLTSTDVVSAAIPEQNTDQDKFRLDIQIKSNPQLKVNITKVDEEDNNILIPRVEFELTARIVKDNMQEYSSEELEKLTLNTSQLTEENYLSQVIDRLKIYREDVEQIKQTIVIENLINELKNNNKLSAEEEEEISSQVNNNLKINRIITLGKATKTQINDRINAVTNRIVLDKLVEQGKVTNDRINELLNTIKNQLRLDVDNITTNSKGLAVAYMDNTLANKTIEYTLKETRKAEGYDWLDEVVIFEISYDSEGKMVADEPIRVVSGTIDITNINQENFEISATVKNKASDEVYIHLSVEDVYAPDKKLETASFDAFLVDPKIVDLQNSITYSPDNKYRVALETGSVTSSTGLKTAHGEDTEMLGIYEEGAGGRILRLVQKQTPTSYYLGNERHEAVYQSIPYALLINVMFDDEGSILDTSIHSPGGDTRKIGYAADGRYIQVSNTRNTINITIRYYPMLQVQMQTVDMYTGASLQGKYTITTDNWNDAITQGECVTSGYIDAHQPGYYYGRTYTTRYTTDTNLTTIDNAGRVALSPTEADRYSENRVPDKKERMLYIYENAEPNSPIQYQTYTPRYYLYSRQCLIAKIKVKYDDKGQVISSELIQEISQNNIKSGFIRTIKSEVHENTIQIIVKYAPITTITATVIDEVSGVGIPGIRINPYLDGNEVTKTSYEHRLEQYYTTGNSGRAGWTYWGASIPGGQNRYVLDTYTFGSGYEGYFDPGNIILDVSYDENGRISGVIPKSTDAYGDVNAINISWSQNNNIQLTIRYSRKFTMQLYKVDYYNTNKKLNAVFDVLSGKGTQIQMAANTKTVLGKVYPGQAVKYTLSETTVPSGYLPVENLDIIVQFNNNGSIRSATSASPYFEFVGSAKVDTGINSLDKIDLRANIKNKPRFDVAIDLSDKFYPTLKLEGGTFTIENSKGDTSSGGIRTDRNGILETYVGTVYPNEEVTYTVAQTNVIPGYYENNTLMKFKVHFNTNGKVESYTLTDGTDVATIDPARYIGTQGIKLSVTNKPKDIRLGLYKYDGLTNGVMQDIKFTITTEEVGKRPIQKTLVTNSDGTAVDVVDTFVESNNNRVVKYTISEIEAAKTYRKIQDIVIQVTYKQDGSIYLYDVLSNPSNVVVELATNKQIKYTGSTPVHLKLTIPNDNAYDVIVKNEDTNYAGLGIEGTAYDISINGVNKGTITTNANGIAAVSKQTQKGDIEIVITERNIGEGYRENNNNTTTIQIEKGIEEYTLKLVDNSNPTYATVVVDEEHGTITVTFKNETKLELTMQKEDINTGALLEGAEFEIREVEIDSLGNEIDGTENIITADKIETPEEPEQPEETIEETGDEGETEGSEEIEGPQEPVEVNTTKTTGKDGVLYFDLGLSKQNKTMKYVFTEKTAPEGYEQIFPITVTVKFDRYGHIIEMKDDSIRAEETLASNTGKSHHMIVVIGNGTINEAYTVKVLTEDSTTGMRINGSIFQVEAIETATGSTNKSITGATKDVTKTIAGNKEIFEQGALRVTGITAEGEVTINFRQIETATGYIYGSNQTSGTVKVKAEFELVDNESAREVTLSPIDNGGFDVSIDNINKEITIKVKNEPQVTFEITKVDADTKSKMEGAKFNIKSAVVTNGTLTNTELNEDIKATNKDGYTQAEVGHPYAGKTVIYTLTEEQIPEYDPLDDIILSVQYDGNGNIAEYKILSSEDDVTIKPDSQKDIQKRVMTEKDLVGVVDIQYSTIQIPTGIGTRILQMEVNNYRTPIPKDYQIQIGKYHVDASYPYLIPGAKYEITVTQEYGKQTTTWVDITDENGVITSPYFSGHGLIEVAIKELEAPEGYKLDSITRTTRFIRNEVTQRMVIQSTDSGCTFNDDFTMVYLKAMDEIVSGKYSMIINKVDVKNGALIAQNPAEIKIEMVEKHETINQTLNEETGEVEETIDTSLVRVPIVEKQTDEYGRIVLSGLIAPSKPGEYTYILSEKNAPKGYNGISENEVEMVVTFEQNEDQEMIITNAIVKDAEDVKIARTSDKVMSIIVYNEKQDEDDDIELKDNEFVLDIRKVDKELYQITTGTAEFILTDTQTNEETKIVTDELGRAEMQKMKMPTEAGKYKYMLKEIKAPNGYKLLEENMYILLEFAENEEGKIYLSKATTEGEHLVYANPAKEEELPNRKIQLKVINEDMPYTIKIEKHHESDPYYPYFIPEVEFDIKVTEEFPKTDDETKVTTWTDITNETGIITKGNFDGYGRIRIEATEKSAPDKYKQDFETKFIELYRDKYTKELREYDSNVNYELDEVNQVIILKPVNEVISGIYDLVINKIDKTNNIIITNNPATFNLYMIKKYYTNSEDGGEPEITEIKEPILENVQTDNLGILIKDAISMPTEAGTYTFELEEVQAPIGYEGLKEKIRYEMTLQENDKDELIITDIKILNGQDNVKVLAYRDQLITLSVANNNSIPEGSISLDITKVDTNEKPITTDTAVFKITDSETGEVVSYIETNKNSGTGYQYINKPTKPGEYSYTLNEMKAPEGYALDRQNINLKVTYEQDEEKGLYISRISVEGGNVIYEQPEEGQIVGNRIQLKVKNEVGEQSGGANDKPYTVVINKIDKETGERIKDHATFDLTLVNGEVIHASTNEEGQIIMENVHMPLTPGENEIIIKETKAPKGYELDSEMKVVKVTFSGIAKEMIISEVQLGKINNNNIEVVESECTEDTIVLNILNKSDGTGGNDDDDLYLTSQVYRVTEENVERVKPYTTIKDYIANMESNGVMKVYDINGNEMSDTELVGTKMIITATKGKQSITKVISVIADLDGNGKVTVTDLSMMNQVMVDKLTINGVVEKSADIDDNGGVTVTDLSMMNQIMVGTYTI